MNQAVDIRELNERIQKESAFVDVINMEMGYLTPPFGLNLFVMKGIAPDDVTMSDIYRAIIPFVALQALCLALVMIFPQIALWLPNTLVTK